MTANKEKDKARCKAYYEANKEKVKARCNAYREANREKIKIKKKAWNQAHKEEVRAERKSYYKANREKVLARQSDYKKANKEKTKAVQRAYYEANKEKLSTRSRAYHEANKERESVRSKAHRKTHEFKQKRKAYCDTERYRGMARAHHAKRRSLKTQSTLPTTDYKLIKKIYYQRAVTAEENGEQYHVDHIIPLSIGGAHHQDNLRIITAQENLEKADKYIPELGGVWADNDLAREYKKKHNIE